MIVGLFIGLVAIVIGSGIVALIFGPVLMILSRLIAQREPSFGESFKAMFFATVVGAAANVVWGLVTSGAGGEEPGVAAELISFGISLAVLTFMIMAVIEATLGRAILTALAVTAVQFLVYMLIGVAILSAVL